MHLSVTRLRLSAANPATPSTTKMAELSAGGSQRFAIMGHGKRRHVAVRTAALVLSLLYYVLRGSVFPLTPQGLEEAGASSTRSIGAVGEHQGTE
jgi:hypothetical protein